MTEARPGPVPLELVLWHNYGDGGSAQDRSGYENHGRIDGPVTAEGREEGRQALQFDGRDDRVVVLPSPTLRALGIRLTAWVWLTALGGRRTIVEGFSSFSLLIEPDGILEGTIYNGSRWEGVRSRPDLLPFRQWVRITYAYDGVDTSTLEVDGQLVGSNLRPLGAIQPVDWPFGLNIGAWPDGNRRVFAGRIAEVKLWRTPPD